MAEDTYPMTAEGRDKLKKELEDLKVNQRPKVVERIKIARSYGDLSENSEYESAKDEQSMLESRITTVEHMLQYAQIIDSKASDKNEVTVGKKVTFKELPDEDPETYQMLGQPRLIQCQARFQMIHQLPKDLLVTA